MLSPQETRSIVARRVVNEDLEDGTVNIIDPGLVAITSEHSDCSLTSPVGDDSQPGQMVTGQMSFWL